MCLLVANAVPEAASWPWVLVVAIVITVLVVLAGMATR